MGGSTSSDGGSTGASRDRAKYGNKCLRAYLQDGRDVVAVHPRETEVEGVPAYASLAAIPTAPEALSIGLIGHVVPDGRALAKAKEIAAVICENGPLAVAAITRTLHETDGMELDEALRYEWDYGQAVFASADAKEGPLAFAQKRKPNFQGK